jgi:hypothetical protein
LFLQDINGFAAMQKKKKEFDDEGPKQRAKARVTQEPGQTLPELRIQIVNFCLLLFTTAYQETLGKS